MRFKFYVSTVFIIKNPYWLFSSLFFLLFLFFFLWFSFSVPCSSRFLSPTFFPLLFLRGSYEKEGTSQVALAEKKSPTGFSPWVRKIPWRSKWQPLLPGESLGQKSLVGYSPRGCKESDITEHTHTHNLPINLKRNKMAHLVKRNQYCEILAVLC